jgi:hypothetical protein
MADNFLLAGLAMPPPTRSCWVHIVGGKAAGTRTAWVNRLSVPFDTIGERPDITSLADLADELAS